MCAFAVVFQPGGTPNTHAMGPLQHPTCDFGLIWGVGSGFSTKKHKPIRKVARWLPRACRIGAAEAVEWVRGRCLGGAASFLDKDWVRFHCSDPGTEILCPVWAFKKDRKRKKKGNQARWLPRARRGVPVRALKRPRAPPRTAAKSFFDRSGRT